MDAIKSPAQGEAISKGTAADNQYNTVNLCSGNGKYHTNNSEAENPKPLNWITVQDIALMLTNPDQVKTVPKDNAQWVIPCDYQSRDHAELRSKGNYWALWFDGDELNGVTQEQSIDCASTIIDGQLLAWSSRSATEEQQKHRVFVPLSRSLTGIEWIAYQRLFNDKMEKLGVTPDRVSERCGQPCFLPNRGEFFKTYVDDFLPPFNPDQWADEVAEMLAEDERIKQEAKQQYQANKIKLEQLVNTQGIPPRTLFSQAHDSFTTWVQYGATPQGKRLLSPYSETGSAAIIVLEDDTWISHHGSDQARGVGRTSADGHTQFGDSFDLYCHFEHGGNENAAVKAVAEMLDPEGQKQRQREYMEAKEQKELADMIENLTPENKVFSLSDFALNGRSHEMRLKMLEDVHILGELALLGQATAIYAKPGSGKTLLTMWLIIDAIKAGRVKAENVFYINADDTHKGLTQKLELAEQYGFYMLAPGYNDFNASHFALYVKALTKNDNAHGKIIILDTLKKFTNLMDKNISSDFGKIAREFTSQGGSIVALAHVNKKRDEEGKVVFSGTSDITDDFDCYYTLDILTSDVVSNIRTVEFENHKNRGDVVNKAVYSYDCNPPTPYDKKLESVHVITAQEENEIKEQRIRDEILERNAESVAAIKDTIREGITNRTELIKHAHELSGETKRKITKALDQHTGKNIAFNQFWNETRGEKNARIYALNWGV